VPRPLDGPEAPLRRPHRPTPGRRAAPGLGSREGSAAAALLAALLLAGAAGAAGAPSLAVRLAVWGFTQGEQLQQPRGIAFDPRDGALYVANTGAHRIEVFSRAGRPLSRFVHRVSRPDGAVVDGEPCALAVDRSGHLLVADKAAAYVDVLDWRGRPVTRLAIPAGHPAALAVGRDGTIFVGTTAEESKVHVFRADYAPAGSWGEPGSDPGHLFDVTALTELADSTIAVACARTDLGVQLFTRTGDYLRGFATHELGSGNVSLPSGIAGTADGRIWVSDEIRQSLQVFEQDGTFVVQLGERGTAAGEFSHPSSLASDGHGLIAVTERNPGRFQVLAVVNGE
jgi:hypothetical protein